MIRALAFLALLAGPAQAADNLPFEIGGDFDLVDQYGEQRSQADPDGHAQLLFFGYANCPGICPVAMPMMAYATDLLSERGLTVHPVMITVDPDRDRVESMAAPMQKLHPDFVGLTGSEAALNRAYKAFSVEKELLFDDPEQGAVYAHGAFVYLLDGQGKVLTLLPPVLDAERVADIAQGYLAAKE